MVLVVADNDMEGWVVFADRVEVLGCGRAAASEFSAAPAEK